MPAVRAVVDGAPSNEKMVTKGARGVNTYLPPARRLGGRRFALYFGGGGRYWEFPFRQSQLGADFVVDGGANVWIVFEELTGIFAALADAIAFVAVPGAALFNHIVRDAEINEVALTRDAFAVDDVEFGFAEWRGYLILYDLHLGTVAHHHVTFFNGGNAADICTNRGVEFQCASARSGFGTAEHDADLFTNLIDKDEAGIRF